jgi:hypothetical protein
MVDVYVALTQVIRREFIDGSLPAVTSNPNFVHPDPGTGRARVATQRSTNSSRSRPGKG